MPDTRSPWDDIVTSLSDSPRTWSARRGNGFNIAVLVILLLCFLVFAVFFDDGVPEKPSQNKTPTRKTENQHRSPLTGKDYRIPSSVPVVEERSIPIADTEVCQVDRCVDGDTIVVFSGGRKERVRFIGSNTPETVKKNAPVEAFGPEASAYTEKRISDYRNIVTLVVDGDRTDQYGRRLALVYLGKDQASMLNEELIRLGLAKAETRYHYSRIVKERFIQAENLAKSERRGIWSMTLPPAPVPASASNRDRSTQPVNSYQSEPASQPLSSQPTLSSNGTDQLRRSFPASEQEHLPSELPASPPKKPDGHSALDRSSTPSVVPPTTPRPEKSPPSRTPTSQPRSSSTSSEPLRI